MSTYIFVIQLNDVVEMLHQKLRFFFPNFSKNNLFYQVSTYDKDRLTNSNAKHDVTKVSDH